MSAKSDSGDRIKTVSSNVTVSIHCAPEMSEIDCIGRIESFRPNL